MTDVLNNSDQIFKQYNEITQVVLLEDDFDKKLILFGDVEENTHLKLSEQITGYSILTYNHIKDRKLKKTIKKEGYKIYKKQVNEFINYCACTVKMRPKDFR